MKDDVGLHVDAAELRFELLLLDSKDCAIGSSGSSSTVAWKADLWSMGLDLGLEGSDEDGVSGEGCSTTEKRQQ
jgi:hypothetical protein